MSTTCVPSPENLVECQSWRNRCLRLYDNREATLCRLLGVERRGLEMALLEARTLGMSHEVRQAAAQWHDAENELAHALSLLETAEAIQHNREFLERDE